MKHIEIKISFNIEEKDYRTPEFQEFLNMFKTNKAKNEMFSNPIFKMSDQKVELKLK